MKTMAKRAFAGEFITAAVKSLGNLATFDAPERPARKRTAKEALEGDWQRVSLDLHNAIEANTRGQK